MFTTGVETLMTSGARPSPERRREGLSRYQTPTSRLGRGDGAQSTLVANAKGEREGRVQRVWGSERKHKKTDQHNAGIRGSHRFSPRQSLLHRQINSQAPLTWSGNGSLGAVGNAGERYQPLYCGSSKNCTALDPHLTGNYAAILPSYRHALEVAYGS
ncbi:hypothetical protein B0T17DRAFT_598489 [Bombardia bombarda]|uniref:Uncharacterized protein n=1 Tax=Bombardia bombarda TaxID=252184 RepID=A0AA39XAC3_9PEZI|nr:hypothetical protein B0T17DRAFT_598489 [Bombardia bombarda]